jgi:hypothetical protein
MAIKNNNAESGVVVVEQWMDAAARRVEDAEKELIRAVSHCEEACLAERRALDRVEELEKVLTWVRGVASGEEEIAFDADEALEAIDKRVTAALAAKGVRDV